MISVSQLTKAYGSVLAVDHISFEVGKGQIVGFLGPNGAGKSTTLRMLTCYMPPTSGGATINGFDIFHQSEQVRQNLGYLPENMPLYTRNEGEEYLDFRGRLRGMDRTSAISGSNMSSKVAGSAISAARHRSPVQRVCGSGWVWPIRCCTIPRC